MNSEANDNHRGDFHLAALACIQERQPASKVSLTRETHASREAGLLSCDSLIDPIPIPIPGRPWRPVLVNPRHLPRRGLHTEQGRLALIHAIAHIEFNAINLAWDAVYRFRGMPDAFYDEWAQVALEEAYHFELLQSRLVELGAQYGDLPAHDGLWQMACETDHDVMVRMALVPRVLEARGLDVTPGMVKRLTAIGDTRTVDILQVILRDEIGHVAVGSKWFNHICNRRGLEPEVTFLSLINQYMKGQVREPFHLQARYDAGFSVEEMQALSELSRSKSK